MYRVFLLALVFVSLQSQMSGERVLSREKSFIAPSVVVRKEVKKEEAPPRKIPIAAPRIIALDVNESHTSHTIIARSSDTVLLNSFDLKFSQNSFYSLNGGPFLSTMGAIHLPKPGSYQLTYYSVDFFGNRDTGKTRILVIDDSPPKIEFRFNPPRFISEDAESCAQGSFLTILASDSLSGIRSIFWKQSEEEIWKRYNQPILISKKENQTFSIQAYAEDLAGNVTIVETISCYVI